MLSFFADSLEPATSLFILTLSPPPYQRHTSFLILPYAFPLIVPSALMYISYKLFEISLLTIPTLKRQDGTKAKMLCLKNN